MRATEGESSTLQRRNIEAIAKVEAAVRGERSRGERLSRFIIKQAGRPRSVAAHIVVFACWIAWNSQLLHAGHRFDPYPFNLLALCASLEAILVALLILTSQNRLQHEADRRAHLNLQINMMAEVEGTKMLQMLDSLRRHFGIRAESEDLLDELKAETNPEQIVETIKTSMPVEE